MLKIFSLQISWTIHNFAMIHNAYSVEKCGKFKTVTAASLVDFSTFNCILISDWLVTGYFFLIGPALSIQRYHWLLFEPHPLSRFTHPPTLNEYTSNHKMREIVHLQAGQCGNQIGAKVTSNLNSPMMLQFGHFEPFFSCKCQFLTYLYFSSGRLSPTSTVLTRLDPTRELQTYSWRGLMFIMMKPAVENM